MSAKRLWLILLSIAVTAPRLAAHEASVPSVGALHVEGELTLDGRLDEPDWRRAEVATGFRQREPDELQPATQETEIRILYTRDTLWVGIRAFDSSPGELVALEMGRDSPLFRDDAVIVLLDTFHDHRNAYFFEVNPNGSRTDALITDEGRDFNIDWDGVWNAAARIDDQGWSAEMAIPFRTLRFDPHSPVWGLQIRREIRRRSEETFWSPIGVDAEAERVSRYGHLTGLSGPGRPTLSQGTGLSVKPFVAATAGERDDGDSFDETELGLDLKWAVTRGLALDLTLNTDFAETEVDEQRTNLTRFSLFFPEKREFFLENSGIFEFGNPGSPLFRLFFSRRIGIADDGEEVPLDAGARLAGRVGDWSLGLLQARTGRATTEDGEIPATDWSVARVRRNIGERSTVGVMATLESGDGTAAAYGVDWNLRPTDRLSLWGFAAGSDPKESADDGGEILGAGAEWEGSLWQWEAGVVDIDEDFSPSAGFLRRSGIRMYSGEVTYAPRPESGPILNYEYEAELEVFERPDGTTESLKAQIEPFGFRSRSDDGFGLFVELEEENLIEPFEIADGVVIPTGRYSFLDAGARYGTSESRPLSVSGFFVAGEFFDGDRWATRGTIRWRPSRYFRSETSFELEDVELPFGDFTDRIVRQRLSGSLTPDLTASAFVQYNDRDEIAALNLRFNWIYRPGADLFVVFNQTWDAPDGVSDLATRDRQVIVKLTYLWQR